MIQNLRLLFFSAVLFLSFAIANSATEESSGESRDKAVKVISRRDGETTHFYVQNSEACEVTMTFEMSFSNLQGCAQFPYTGTFPPGRETEAFSLSPIQPGAKWEYSYTNYFKLVSQTAQHDDSYVYQLPYAPGNEFKVTQAYDGSFSHKGANLYAIDWKMPEGTPVRAARGGLVVKIKEDSDKGGSSIKYDKFNNYVLIRHEDGTLGHYCHLRKNSCIVKAGQTVQAGEVIARSGNTGFSSGPHLHFSVFKARNGRERESIPIKFKTSEARSTTLASGHRYKAPENRSAQSEGLLVQ